MDDNPSVSCCGHTVRVPLEITLQFRTNGFFLNATDEIYIRMPRFTSGDGSGASGPTFEIHQHSWATLFQLNWHEHEHTKSQSEPFPLSNLTLRVRQGRLVEPTRAYEVRSCILNSCPRSFKSVVSVVHSFAFSHFCSILSHLSLVL
jgi:hypothetical protein